jgi:hypothetical protein
MKHRNQRQNPQEGKPGKGSPASFALKPEASAPRLHQKNRQIQSQNLKAKPSASKFIGRGFVADFFGASPVASASGIRPGATPYGRIHTNTRFSIHLGRYDISTLPGTRHFYFALTAHWRWVSRQSENVVLEQSRNVVLTRVKLGKWRIQENYS